MQESFVSAVYTQGRCFYELSPGIHNIVSQFKVHRKSKKVSCYDEL